MVEDKIIYCPCDAEWSNIVKVIQDYKDILKYKELIYTSDDFRTHDDLFEYCFNKKNITNSDYINACISIFHIFITLFRIMDDILNLKYKDGPEIIKMLSSNEHHFIILNHLYNFAITDKKDPGDYEIMVKNCFDCLFN